MEQKINGPITEYNKPFILQRADPFVGRAADGSYYFTASVPAYDRIILRHADRRSPCGPAMRAAP